MLRRYIMEWEHKKRLVPLRKILDIFHELRNQHSSQGLACYVLISPQLRPEIDRLKARNDLTFYWEYDLKLRDSIFFSYESTPTWIGMCAINDPSSVDALDEILFHGNHYPVGTLIMTTNTTLTKTLRDAYPEFLDGPLMADLFATMMMAKGGVLAYEVTIAGEYFDISDDRETDEFLIKWDELLNRHELFDWAKILVSYDESPEPC